ncbi:hypothetical protein Bbelb_184740 [Branchiostoma belcheri]|nr:hypothetical protein Bbelb_184740 [Branchiostoma belcheri]
MASVHGRALRTSLVKIPPRKTRHVRFGEDDMDKVINLEGEETDDRSSDDSCLNLTRRLDQTRHGDLKIPDEYKVCPDVPVLGEACDDGQLEDCPDFKPDQTNADPETGLPREDQNQTFNGAAV